MGVPALGCGGQAACWKTGGCIKAVGWIGDKIKVTTYDDVVVVKALGEVLEFGQDGGGIFGREAWIDVEVENCKELAVVELSCDVMYAAWVCLVMMG